MSARLACLLVAASLVAVLAGACRRNACRTGEASCDCPQGASCAQECTGAEGCSVRCANGNGDCAISAGDACTADCSGAETCKAMCGRGSKVTCPRAAEGTCQVAVGDGSSVHCEGSRLCDVRCAGAWCDVDCPAGHCIVACATAGRCRLGCPGPTTTCGDGTTLACGVACQ